MDYRVELQRPRSKAIIAGIVQHIGADADRFAQLMALVRDSDPRLSELASWPMSVACNEHPELGIPWTKLMVDLLHRPVHTAIHRNVLRSLQFCPIPERFHGRLTDFLFRAIPDPQRTIAVRAFGITVAMRLVRAHPALAPEFRLLLEESLRVDPGPAIRSRAKRTLKELARMQAR
ncbi:MAG: hypothetical protein R2818_11240 [Flavobacteriales bacterium]